LLTFSIQATGEPSTDSWIAIWVIASSVALAAVIEALRYRSAG